MHRAARPKRRRELADGYGMGEGWSKHGVVKATAIGRLGSISLVSSALIVLLPGSPSHIDAAAPAAAAPTSDGEDAAAAAPPLAAEATSPAEATAPAAVPAPAPAAATAPAPAPAPAPAAPDGEVTLAPLPRCPPFPDPRATTAGDAVKREYPEPTVALPDDPLAPVSRDSTSSGSANQGRLQRAAALAVRGKHHRILPGRELRRFGTRELIDALVSTARQVAARHGGSVLGVGNLSLRQGGKIPVSVSHQSGRDVDLALFAREAKSGRALQPSSFVRFGPDGRSLDRKQVFDAARNWTVVEALVMHPANTQWIFISEPLRRLLLAEGRRRGAAAEALARVEQVLRQPLGSLPHDDHFHVRIHCAPDDLLDDCHEFGPRRAWSPVPRRSLEQRVAALRRLLDDVRAPRPRRLAALQRITTLGSPAAAPSLLALLGDRDLDLVLAALRGLRALAVRQSAAAVAQHLEPGAPLPLLAAGLDTLEALGSWQVDSALLALARDLRPLPATGAGALPRRGQPTPTVAGRALEVLAGLAPPSAIPGLAALLDEPGLADALAGSCRAALARITGRADPGARPGESEGQAWSRWWAEHRSQGRPTWMLSGLADAGYPLPGGPCALENVPQLAAAVDDQRPYVRRNARDLIHAVAGMPRWRPGDRLLAGDFWRSWWTTVGEPAARQQAQQQEAARAAADPAPAAAPARAATPALAAAPAPAAATPPATKPAPDAAPAPAAATPPAAAPAPAAAPPPLPAAGAAGQTAVAP